MYRIADEVRASGLLLLPQQDWPVYSLGGGVAASLFVALRPDPRLLRVQEEEAEDRLFLQSFDRIEVRAQQRITSDLRKKRLTYAMIGAAALSGLVIVITLSVGLTRHAVTAYSCPEDKQSQYGLTFFVLGDWGRHGNDNQRKAAHMMAEVANCMPPRFIISTGDNFYSHGLQSTSDPQFQKSFVDVYNQASLQVDWYAVLGNHDYGDGIDPDSNSCAAKKLEDCPKDCCYSSTWQFTGRVSDPRWHCQNGVYSVPTGSSGLVDIVMMDTNPLMSRYKDTTWYYNAGGLSQQDPEGIKSQVHSSLSSSQARWKFVVGHHPVASFGSHCAFAMQGDCQEMQWLEPVMQKTGVAAYLCGHDHNLQYVYKLSDPNVSESPPAWPVYVVSGAGSDVRYNEDDHYRPKDGYKQDYMADDQGFVAVRVNNTHAVMYYYSSSHSGPSHTVVLVSPSQ